MSSTSFISLCPSWLLEAVPTLSAYPGWYRYEYYDSSMFSSWFKYNSMITQTFPLSFNHNHLILSWWNPRCLQKNMFGLNSKIRNLEYLTQFLSDSFASKVKRCAKLAKVDEESGIRTHAITDWWRGVWTSQRKIFPKTSALDHSAISPWPSGLKHCL